jgi:hypothetical protein
MPPRRPPPIIPARKPPPRRWKVVEHDVDGGVRMVSDDIVDLLLCVTVQLDMDADPDATAG